MPQTDVSPTPPDSYLTIGTAATTEIKIQRSRFIASVDHTATEATAREFIAAQRAKYHDCRHICHGWRIGTPPATSENRNDDGEPSGTAGDPILAEIRKRELTEVVVVVIRYFGGIKLGTGGLARAYGQAAGTALTAAATRAVHLGRTFQVEFPYAQQKTLAHLLKQHAGEIVSEDYGAKVVWTLWLSHSQWRRFAANVQEATAGSVDLAPTPIEKEGPGCTGTLTPPTTSDKHST